MIKYSDDVFFFGAGFSHALNPEYPLLYELSEKILKEDNLKDKKLLETILKEYHPKNKESLEKILQQHNIEDKKLLLEEISKNNNPKKLLEKILQKDNLKKYEKIYKDNKGSNIESLLTFLSSPLPFKDDITRSKHEVEYKETLKAIREYFIKLDDKDFKPTKKYQFKPYAKNIAEYIKKNHCPCITLNYDILLERMIESVYNHSNDNFIFNLYKMPITDIIERTSTEFNMQNLDYKQSFPEIIKLHGSINWYYNNIKQDDTIYYVPTELYYTTLNGQEQTEKKINLMNILITDLVPFIIPPVLDKQSQYNHSVIGFLWRRAFDFIKNAKNIYIVGFSFPATDLAIKFLFQSALAQNTNDYKIYLVKIGDKETQDRYKEVFRNKYNVTRFNKAKNNNVESLGNYLKQILEKQNSQ